MYVRGDLHVCPNPLSFDPYSICEWDCKYCWIKEMYHTVMRRKASQGVKPFKAEALARVLKKAFSNEITNDPVVACLRAGLPVLIGRKCEPFGPSEKSYGATRRALRMLSDYGVAAVVETKGVEGVVSTVTRFEKVGVLVSVTPGPDPLHDRLEPGTPSFADRFRMARELSEAGIWVGLTAEPIIPSVNDSDEYFKDYARRAKEAGVKHVNFGGYRFHNVKIAYRRMMEAGVDLLRVAEAAKGWRERGLSFMRFMREEGLPVSSPEWDSFYAYNSCFSCCGLDHLGYHKLNFQYALKLLREKGIVRFRDVIQHNIFGKQFEERFREIWNGKPGYFSLSDARGVVKVGLDEEGNAVFQLKGGMVGFER